MMQQLLNTTRQLTLGAYKHETECGCTATHSYRVQGVVQDKDTAAKHSVFVCVLVAELELRTREKLEVAKKKTSLEITELKEKLKASRENINFLKEEIRKLEEEDQLKEH